MSGTRVGTFSAWEFPVFRKKSTSPVPAAPARRLCPSSVPTQPLSNESLTELCVSETVSELPPSPPLSKGASREPDSAIKGAGRGAGLPSPQVRRRVLSAKGCLVAAAYHVTSKGNWTSFSCSHVLGLWSLITAGNDLPLRICMTWLFKHKGIFLLFDMWYEKVS